MFCTLICCMDGRFIHIINEYIRKNYEYNFVDTITDAGPVNKIINEQYLKDIEDKIVLISVNKHKSDHIFIAGHSDCAGCPIDDDKQKKYIYDATKMIHEDLNGMKTTGLFVSSDGSIEIINDLG